MRYRIFVILLMVFLVWPTAHGEASKKDEAKKADFENIYKDSQEVLNLKRILLPFVATCSQAKTHFRKLFCSALNERLKAQHQHKVYRITMEPSAAGPLIVKYKAKPSPIAEVSVLGCLTCKEPMVEREGGDVSKGRFFLFKTPKDIRIRRGGKVLYDLGNIGLASYKIPLPKGMTEKKFKKDVLPFIKLDLIYRPVAGVTKVGRRFKYGVTSFELLGHRAYEKCTGDVYGALPAMTTSKLPADKNDLNCPANRPKVAVAKPNLPANIPQAKVKAIMEVVSEDLRVCYEQFGVRGDVPADVVVTPDGKVKVVKVAGKLAGTATGKCVERLVRNITFPKFAGRDARLQWPFSLK